ncbi:protein of unknown function [Streptomyces sp. KY70]|nr:protein of unknown function [Streptomyces sp. KY70]
MNVEQRVSPTAPADAKFAPFPRGCPGPRRQETVQLMSERPPQRTPNRRLASLIAEAGFSHAGLARRVDQLGLEHGLDLRYDKTSVTRWLRGQQPRGTTPALIAEVFTRRLGRRLSAQDLGLDACAPVYAGLEFAATPTEAVDIVSGLWRKDSGTHTELRKIAFTPAGLVVPSRDWLIGRADEWVAREGGAAQPPAPHRRAGAGAAGGAPAPGGRTEAQAPGRTDGGLRTDLRGAPPRRIRTPRGPARHRPPCPGRWPAVGGPVRKGPARSGGDGGPARRTARLRSLFRDVRSLLGYVRSLFRYGGAPRRPAPAADRARARPARRQRRRRGAALGRRALPHPRPHLRRRPRPPGPRAVSGARGRADAPRELRRSHRAPPLRRGRRPDPAGRLDLLRHRRPRPGPAVLRPGPAARPGRRGPRLRGVRPDHHEPPGRLPRPRQGGRAARTRSPAGHRLRRPAPRPGPAALCRGARPRDPRRGAGLHRRADPGRARPGDRAPRGRSAGLGPPLRRGPARPRARPLPPRPPAVPGRRPARGALAPAAGPGVRS